MNRPKFEVEYIPLPDYLRKPKKCCDEPDKEHLRAWTTLLIVLIIILIGTAITTLTNWTDVQKVHAQEIPHDNAWYCAHLSQYTNGGDSAITKICNSL